MEKKKLKSIIESLLFINEQPIEINSLLGTIEIEKKELITALAELSDEYKNRNSGICVVQVAGGYQMCSSPDNETWAKKMYREKSKQKLSTAALETLAIIAYKQPVTRIEIEAIRGVNVDGVVRKLTDLGLIKISGRKDVVGNPFVYITTRKFLEYFGINSLKDLPRLEDFVALAEKDLISDQIGQENTNYLDNQVNGDTMNKNITSDKVNENNTLKKSNSNNAKPPQRTKVPNINIKKHGDNQEETVEKKRR